MATTSTAPMSSTPPPPPSSSSSSTPPPPPSSPSPPPSSSSLSSFSLTEPRYAQSTFLGRLRHFVSMTDPRTLAPSLFFGLSLSDARALLAAYADDPSGASLPPSTSAERLWLARKIRDASVHPDTDEVIAPPFRMAGYVPFGVPIVIGMLWPVQSTASTVLWQWANQSHNALVNYSNRPQKAKRIADDTSDADADSPPPSSSSSSSSSSSPSSSSSLFDESSRTFLVGYTAAVGGAISVALTLRASLGAMRRRVAASRGGTAPSWLGTLERLVSYPATAAANVLNVYFMRRAEITEGISVHTADGDAVGVSSAAARRAIVETAATRVFLPAPILVLPPLVMSALERNVRIVRECSRVNIAANVVVATASFAGALPVAIALFEQRSSVNVDALEQQFHELRTRDGARVERLYYNKGL